MTAGNICSISAQLHFVSFQLPVKPDSAGSKRAVFIEMLHLLHWMGSTSQSPVQTTVGDTEIASLASASVTWDTQVMHLCKPKGCILSCFTSICFNFFPTVEQDSCVPSVASPTELTEGFEGKLSPLWQSLSGGQIGGGCGIISEGKALYFSSPGRREARTVPLDTSNTR